MIQIRAFQGGNCVHFHQIAWVIPNWVGARDQRCMIAIRREGEREGRKEVRGGWSEKEAGGKSRAESASPQI